MQISINVTGVCGFNTKRSRVPFYSIYSLHTASPNYMYYAIIISTDCANSKVRVHIVCPVFRCDSNIFEENVNHIVSSEMGQTLFVFSMDKWFLHLHTFLETHQSIRAQRERERRVIWYNIHHWYILTKYI